MECGWLCCFSKSPDSCSPFQATGEIYQLLTSSSPCHRGGPGECGDANFLGELPRIPLSKFPLVFQDQTALQGRGRAWQKIRDTGRVWPVQSSSSER